MNEKLLSTTSHWILFSTLLTNWQKLKVSGYLQWDIFDKIKNLLNVENWKRIFRKKEDILKAFRECFLGNFSWNCYDVDIKIFTCDLCSATQCTILPDEVCFSAQQRKDQENYAALFLRIFLNFLDISIKCSKPFSVSINNSRCMWTLRIKFW